VLRKKLGDRQSDKGIVDVGGGARDTVLDGGRKTHANRHSRPLILIQHGFQCQPDRFGGGRPRCLDPGALGQQHSGGGINDGRLDTRSTHINAQYFHNGLRSKLF